TAKKRSIFIVNEQSLLESTNYIVFRHLGVKRLAVLLLSTELTTLKICTMLFTKNVICAEMILKPTYSLPTRQKNTSMQ
ncbi:hypothetical protein CGH27_23505, partial [Vibrio parahaemolyticus]